MEVFNCTLYYVKYALTKTLVIALYRLFAYKFVISTTQLYGTHVYLNNALHFKEPLQVVDLSKGHDKQYRSFKYRPHNHTGVGALVN